MRIPTDSYFSTQLSMMSDQYENLNRLLMLQAKEKKILNAADDPVLANRIQATKDYIASLDSYTQNQIIAENRSQVFESSTKEALNSIKNIKTLIIQAQNDTLSDDVRSNIARSLQGELNTLLKAANTKDPSGQYIYSGYSTDTTPYIQTGTTFKYVGSGNTTTINIGPNSETLFNECGDNVFGNIPLGNGSFTVNASSANTGSASTSIGSVTNSASYVADTYTIQFVTNSAGKLAYQVVGATSGQVVPPLPQTTPADAPEYVDGQTIDFNGVNISITGAAAVGDSFTIKPDQHENVFNTLQKIINALQQPTKSGDATDSNKLAFLHQNLSQGAGAFDQVLNRFTAYVAQVGVRSQAINTEKEVDAKTLFNQAVTLQQLEEPKDGEWITKINQQKVSLEAIQETYVQIQKTLMDLMKV